MKQILTFDHPSFYQQLIIFVFLSLSLLGCSVQAKMESPVRFGYGACTMPGWQTHNPKNSIHSVLGYSRFNYSGGGGQTNFLQIGPQFRTSLNPDPLKGFWVGGEATYIYVKSVIDDYDSYNSHASAFTVGAISGYRFYAGKIPASVYLAAALFHRGAFSNNNGASATGFHGRFGFDIHYMSLLNKKGS